MSEMAILCQLSPEDTDYRVAKVNTGIGEHNLLCLSSEKSAPHQLDAPKASAPPGGQASPSDVIRIQETEILNQAVGDIRHRVPEQSLGSAP